MHADDGKLLDLVDTECADVGSIAFVASSICNINRGRLAALESLDRFVNLQSLTLINLSGFKSLPAQVCACKHLTLLKLMGCSSMTALPPSIGACTALQCLTLKHCPSLTALPESIADCTLLAELDCESCTSLRGLPGGLRRLAHLQRVCVCKCTHLATGMKDLAELKQIIGKTFECDDSLLPALYRYAVILYLILILQLFGSSCLVRAVVCLLRIIAGTSN